MIEDEKCCYCGRPAIRQMKNGKFCCSPYYIQCPAIIEKHKSHFIKPANDPTKCSYCGGAAIKHYKCGTHCCSEHWTKCPAIREKNTGNKGRIITARHRRRISKGKQRWVEKKRNKWPANTKKAQEKERTDGCI